MSFLHQCKICTKELKDSQNSLSLHIYNVHKDITKIEYYHKFIDTRTCCKNCSKEVKFINLQKGYPEYCYSCTCKIIQWGGERGDKRRKLFSDRCKDMPNGTFSVDGGRPKGIKNKNPYPISDAVLQRIESQRGKEAYWNRNTDKIKKQKDTWESKTDEEISNFNTKRTESTMKKGTKYYQGKYTAKHPEKYEGNHSQIFYRSSWELKFFNWVDVNPSVVKWSSEEIIVAYVCPTDGRAHRYFPDSKIQIKGKDGTLKTWLVEIKPASQTVPPKPKAQKTKRFLIEAGTYLKNRAKWEAAERYAKDRNWEFIILTEHHLGL